MTEQELNKKLVRIERIIDLILVSQHEHIYRGLKFNERNELAKLWNEITEDIYPID